MQKIFQLAVDSALGQSLDEGDMLSMDLEMWEDNHSINLEIGLSFVPAAHILDPTQYTTHHFINSTYTDRGDSRKNLDQRENFRFGQSVLVPHDETVALVEAQV